MKQQHNVDNTISIALWFSFLFSCPTDSTHFLNKVGFVHDMRLDMNVYVIFTSHRIIYTYIHTRSTKNFKKPSHIVGAWRCHSNVHNQKRDILSKSLCIYGVRIKKMKYTSWITFRIYHPLSVSFFSLLLLFFFLSFSAFLKFCFKRGDYAHVIWWFDSSHILLFLSFFFIFVTSLELHIFHSEISSPFFSLSLSHPLSVFFFLSLFHRIFFFVSVLEKHCHCWCR